MKLHRILSILTIAAIFLIVFSIPSSAAELDVVLAADINPGSASSNPRYLTVFNGLLIFQADDGTHGIETWRFDGSSAEMIEDFYPGGNGEGSFFTEYLGELYYRAANGTGWHLVKTDGTTVSVVDSTAINPSYLTVYDGMLYFSGFDTGGLGYQLYRYDGSTITRVTSVVNPLGRQFDPRYLTVYNGELYFSACPDALGVELYKYDGSNISLVADINTTGGGPPTATDSYPNGLTLYGGSLLFTANDGTNGVELYDYDGTSAVMVEDGIPGVGINPAGDGVSPEFESAIYAGEIYFMGNDGVNGTELWGYDGAAAYLVDDSSPGPASTSINSPVYFNGEIYFTAQPAAYPFGFLFSYDGVRPDFAVDISNPPFGVDAIDSVVYNGRIYAGAAYYYDSDPAATNGRELVSFEVGGGTPSSPALPDTGFAPQTVTSLPPQPSDMEYKNLGNLWLEIPELGITAPILGIPENSGNWNLNWLSSQVGWLEGTAFPTWAGNSALTAHVYQADGTPGPFKDLGLLHWGDLIIVHYDQQEYIYQVRKVSRTISPYNSSVLRHEEFPWLTLITCRGYDPVSDSYRWRTAVRAVQVRIK